jgi:hypothetical protein
LVLIAKCCLSGSFDFQLAITVKASSGPFQFFSSGFSTKGFKLNPSVFFPLSLFKVDPFKEQ